MTLDFLISLLPLSTLVSVRRRWAEEPCLPISLVDKFNILRTLVERMTQFLQTRPAVSETKSEMEVNYEK